MTDEQVTIDHGKRLASWTFPEFPEHTRGKRWYIIAITFIAVLLVYSLIDKNYLFTIFIALTTFVYILVIQRKPRLITFTITEDGVEVHEIFYPYKDIKKFWIIYEPPEVKSLYFEFNSGIRPTLIVSLGSQNPLIIRDTLLKYLKEDLERDEEFLSDTIQRKLKI